MGYGMYNHETVNNCIDSMVREIEQQQERIAELEKLVRDMCQAYECGGGCVMYDECQHFTDDRCPMEERMKALGIEVDR